MYVRHTYTFWIVGILARPKSTWPTNIHRVWVPKQCTQRIHYAIMLYVVCVSCQRTEQEKMFLWHILVSKWIPSLARFAFHSVCLCTHHFSFLTFCLLLLLLLSIFVISLIFCHIFAPSPPPFVIRSLHSLSLCLYPNCCECFNITRKQQKRHVHNVLCKRVLHSHLYLSHKSRCLAWILLHNYGIKLCARMCMPCEWVVVSVCWAPYTTTTAFTISLVPTLAVLSFSYISHVVNTIANIPYHLICYDCLHDTHRHPNERATRKTCAFRSNFSLPVPNDTLP